MCPTDSHPGSPRPSNSAKTWIASALLAESHTVGGLKKLDFEQIVQSAIDNGVASLLHHVLSRSDSWSEFPASFRESLTRPVRQSMAYDMVREQDLGPLLEQLHSAGIDPWCWQQGTPDQGAFFAFRRLPDGEIRYPQSTGPALFVCVPCVCGIKAILLAIIRRLVSVDFMLELVDFAFQLFVLAHLSTQERN